MKKYLQCYNKLPMIGVMENKKISNKKTQKLPSPDGMIFDVLNDKIDLHNRRSAGHGFKNRSTLGEIRQT